MKFFFYLLLMVQFAAQATVLVVPESFRVLSVNNTPVKQTLFVNETALSFTPGRQILVLQYADMFDSAIYDDHTKVRSEPFVVSFLLEQQSKLKFIPPSIDDLQQAQQYANAPKIEIVDEFGRALELVHSLGSNKNDFSYMVNNPVSNNDVINSGATEKETSTKSEPNSYEMLKFWWLNASEEDKRKFQAFIKTKEG